MNSCKIAVSRGKAGGKKFTLRETQREGIPPSARIRVPFGEVLVAVKRAVVAAHVTWILHAFVFQRFYMSTKRG